MRILLTGAAGRLGSRVCRYLAAQGEEVVAADRRYLTGLPVKLHIVNLLDPQAVYPLIDGCQAVVHLANYPDLLPGLLPQSVYTENITTDANVFHAAMETGVRQIVCSSSIQAIGGDRSGPEELSKPSCLPYLPGDGAMPTVCGNLYALGKQAGENMLKFYAAKVPDRSYTAIRFPWLVNNVDRFRHPRLLVASVWKMDEMFTYLGHEDAAAFIHAVLKTNRSGYACCLAAAPNNRLGWSTAEVVRTFYPNVPLRRPLDELKSLVDLDGLRADYGWEPRQVFELPHMKVDGVPDPV